LKISRLENKLAGAKQKMKVLRESNRKNLFFANMDELLVKLKSKKKLNEDAYLDTTNNFS
jgi:hypothetical protein